MNDPIRVGPCNVCGDSYCRCPEPSSSSGAATDHPRAFAEAILDYTPEISKDGAWLTLWFDEPDQASDAKNLLWEAINSVKPASESEEE